jgi:hypothetical protein
LTHYADLSPCDCRSLNLHGKLLAVGWLDTDFPYPQGEVGEQFVAKLVELLTDPWQPAVAMGRHQCPFCRFSGGPITFQFRNTSVSMGVNNLFVPASEVVYVAPSLILHYIDSHGYMPPEQFRRAVMECPPMRSMPYLKALLTSGGRELVKTQDRQ